MAPDRLKLPHEFSGGADAIIIKADDINKGTILLDSIFLPKHPKDIERLRKPISIEIKSIDSIDDYAIINMTSDELALFVVLTCRAQGRFSENAFVLRPGKDKVRDTSSNIDCESCFLFSLNCELFFLFLVFAFSLLTNQLDLVVGYFFPSHGR